MAVSLAYLSFREGRLEMSMEGVKERMSLANWVFAFSHGYRYEANNLRSGEEEWFEPYVRECTLTKPCQVEVIQFRKPYRVTLVFLFDKTKCDFLINSCQGKWSKLGLTVKNICEKYPSLQINSKELRDLLARCRFYANDLIFALDCMPSVFLICFTHDPRVHGSPFPWKLNYITDPQEMAEIVLNLNLQQAECYF
jgi:hypothetical protein